MNAYSKDLRLRVLDALDRGLSRKEVSELFGLSLSTIKRYVKRRREGEDLEPKPSTGRKRRILSTTEEKRALWSQLQENDEATLESHCQLWEERQGAQRTEGLRESLEELGHERHPHLGDYYGGDGTFCEHRRIV
jgi:transposase